MTDRSKTIYLVWHYDYSQSAVIAAYTDEALADAHAKHEGTDYGVEDIELRNSAPTWRPYYHGMAQVGCENPALDRSPFVEVAGETDEWMPDRNGRVSTCPGNSLIGDDRSAGDAIWLSVFDMDREHVLVRVTEKFSELVERRKAGPLPSWSDLTLAEFRE